MPIVRKKLIPDEVFPSNIRYDEDTDTIQSNVNGEWVDNPDADIRNKTLFPPRITDSTACDAAESVKAAIHTQIDNIMSAIDNASTLFTIAGIILSIFTFGAYGVFIGLALGIGDQMLGFGSAGIAGALTEPVYDTFKCILFCRMNSSGRIKPGQLDFIYTDINAQIGGIGATILNAMLHLAGEGGINNLASLGTSTGDCDDCPCGWCYTFEFSEGALGWSGFAQGASNATHLVSEGWQGGCNSAAYFDTSVEMTFAGTVTSLEFRGWLEIDTGTPDTGIIVNGTQVYSHTAPQFESIHHVDGFWDGSLHVQMFANCQCDSFTQIRAITIRGTGENPFGEDNC